MPLIALQVAPDAELLRIGAELDESERDRRALHEAEDQRNAAREAACRAVCLTPPDHQQDTHAWARL